MEVTEERRGQKHSPKQERVASELFPTACTEHVRVTLGEIVWDPF